MRETRSSGSVRGVRRNPYPYRDSGMVDRGRWTVNRRPCSTAGGLFFENRSSELASYPRRWRGCPATWRVSKLAGVVKDYMIFSMDRAFVPTVANARSSR